MGLCASSLCAALHTAGWELVAQQGALLYVERQRMCQRRQAAWAQAILHMVFLMTGEAGAETGLVESFPHGRWDGALTPLSPLYSCNKTLTGS